ncbi:hypothetical protein C5748_22040 [Phyllobacterium phragmitis]|uniref:Uncharacterized protein n=2 Tax=Phyllobacterium phragmitis TaxID=2670329 RepID=A0A2S9ILG3_9HYPH|nr:hypothetical protein C5748_22040 [Phyllobacterium phragmitis]
MDRRTKEWRRRCDLVAAFTHALGGDASISEVLAIKVEAAAELAVIAEMTRAAFMRGEGVTADDVVRTCNQASRAEKALGIDARAKSNAKGHNPVKTYLAGKVAA